MSMKPITYTSDQVTDYAKALGKLAYLRLKEAGRITVNDAGVAVWLKEGP